MKEEIFSKIALELMNWTPNPVLVLIGALLWTVSAVLIYDLIKTGKKGFGWAAILLLVWVLAFTMRVAISVFRELATSASSSEWDG